MHALKIAVALLFSSPVNALVTSAIPNDGLDDGPTLRSEMATVCADGTKVIELGGGVYDIGVNPGYNHFLRVPCDGLTIVGKGRASKLRMIPSPVPPGGDRHLIEVSGYSDFDLSRVTLDGNKAGWAAFGIPDTVGYPHIEQVHLVVVYSGSRLSFHEMDFIDSPGDCVKAMSTNDVAFVEVRCRGSRRDGINGTSNNSDWRVVASSFTDISDQKISSEADGGNVKRWIVAANNIGAHGAESQLSVDMSRGEDMVFSSNTVDESSVSIYESSRVAVVGNAFSWQASTAALPSLLLKGKTNDVIVASNSILHKGTTDSDSSQCIGSVSLDEARTPEGLLVTGNTCQHAYSYGMRFTAFTGRHVFMGNSIKNIGTLSSTYGLSFTSYGTSAQPPVKGLKFDDNLIWGELAGVRIEARSRDLSAISISDNHVVSTKPGSVAVEATAWTHNGIAYPASCTVADTKPDVASLPLYAHPIVNGQPPPQSGQACLP